MPAEVTQQFSLDARTEQSVIGQVAAAGLAPPVLEIDPALGLVVTEYLADAVPWSVADSQRPHNISRIAAQLKLLHALDLDLPPFACTAAAAAYAQAGARTCAMTAEQSAWRDELLALAASFETRFPAATPCHNDLVAANVLDDGTIRLIDFEYAALSAPILDLASLAALNEFDAAQRARLVAAYYQDGCAPFDAAELDVAIRLVRLLAYFWALAHGAQTTTTAHVDHFAGAMAAMLR
jgi:thiamine kinase-like enzyme